MITIRAGNGAIGICLLLLLTGCSREQQDWRSAEAADTIEAYGHFIQRHPESELAAQARTRVLQLGEDRDWQHAGSADNVDAYREFIAQHPNGKWAQEARIRIENFSLGEQTGTDAATRSAVGAPGGLSAAGRNRGPTAGTAGAGLASPGEAAVPATRLASTPPVPGSSSGGSPAGVGGAGSAPVSRPAVVASSASRDRAPPGSSSPSTGTSTAAAPQATAQLTAPAPAPARVPATAPKGAFGIQLGAFSSEAGANNEWRLLQGRFAPELQGLTEHVIAADAPSGRIYRLQAIVGDESRARAICDSLRKRSQGCVAVLPH